MRRKRSSIATARACCGGPAFIPTIRRRARTCSSNGPPNSFDNSHREASASVDAWERSLAELRPLRPLAAQAQASGSTVVTSSQQSPIIVVDQTLRSRGLEQFRRRSQPTANNGIRVEFENVAFDDLVLWLGELGQHHGMHVQAGSLSVASQSGPGRINASLTLERAL